MLTLQEMFDKSVAGLASQSFAKCGDEKACFYYDPFTDRRCAWGHVDHTIPLWQAGTVLTLHVDGVGVAANLSDEAFKFAKALQRCHDASDGPQDMRDRLLVLVAEFCLQVPETLK